ncbi:recombination regulator RecX [Streptomyces poonensis]|uniref:Regulatory protein RecX n=1 Tax=Streptomyces poonensis TaxID=68255 RepID=A0A918Q8G2_9ACTN|nr:recombination regulator RecX [Streptomyces poonensis]GGZ36274.1 hypothetical protein GCM10010365_66340 [Streptomyces poonensis]GLJ90035.1 hypothetical protein GCM10017589_26360 [Streptomyces poonensis]
MTRRTDWAEYARPVVPGGQGGGDDAGVAPADAEGPYRGWPQDGHRLEDGHRPNGGRPSDGRADGGRADAYGRPGDGTWPDGGPSGTGAWPAGDGTGHGDDGDSDGGGRAQGGRSHGSGGPRGGRGRGSGRGRRRPDFGESSGAPFDRSSGVRQGGADGADGGSSSSSRAGEREPSGDPVERARAICLRLLTGTPRTRKQLADALRKREIPDDVADQVLSRFEEVGLINDSAFADAWVESRHHGRGLARRALAQELRTKGVDATLIDQAVAQLDSDQEEVTARELVARKLRSTRGLDRDKRLRRLAGMLARKGYSQGLALKVVRQALEEEGEDTEGLDEKY